MSSIEVRIPRKQRKRPVSFAANDFLSKKKIVSPGDAITEASNYMRSTNSNTLAQGLLGQLEYFTN